MMARIQSLDRRQIDRVENILIALLALSALLLVGKTGMFQTVTGQTGQNAPASFSGAQGNTLSRGNPVGLMVQNQYGRYGLCYDQAAADSLYEKGLGNLLNQALAAMGDPQPVTQESWMQAVTQQETWVFYDFLYDVSFSHQDNRGEGKGRRFFLTGHNDRAETLYYQNGESGDFYTAQIREGEVPLPAILSTLAPNEAHFAFEDQDLAEVFPPAMLVLPKAPSCPVYTASNPLADLDEGATRAYLEKLGFNLRATTVYESVDGSVIREGTDTLRIQEDGTLIYHGAESGEARWQALSQREKDQQIKAQEVLDLLTGDLMGQGKLFCQSITTLADGETELIFCCLLSGAQVELWEEGWTARVVFQGEVLTAFELHLRRYEQTQDTCAILPHRQAAAVAETMGQSGKELQLCYTDDGAGSPVTADWVVRDGG